MAVAAIMAKPIARTKAAPPRLPITRAARLVLWSSLGYLISTSFYDVARRSNAAESDCCWTPSSPASAPPPIISTRLFRVYRCFPLSAAVVFDQSKAGTTRSRRPLLATHR